MREGRIPHNSKFVAAVARRTNFLFLSGFRRDQQDDATTGSCEVVSYRRGGAGIRFVLDTREAVVEVYIHLTDSAGSLLTRGPSGWEALFGYLVRAKGLRGLPRAVDSLSPLPDEDPELVGKLEAELALLQWAGPSLFDSSDSGGFSGL